VNVTDILHVVLALVAAFLAIVFHEYAHGYVAYRLGDTTARDHGRLTLNPLAHIDPIGTVLLPLLLALFGLPVFGWAKPVPVNAGYFRNPFRGMLFVAISGPITNLSLALLATGIGRLVLSAVRVAFLLQDNFVASLSRAGFYLLGYFVIVNVVLAVFNMIPIPPLDGSRVLSYLLPAGGRRFMLILEQYGFLILLALILLGGLTGILDWTSVVWGRLLGNTWGVLLTLR
jgi:Zn-dependent protease